MGSTLIGHTQSIQNGDENQISKLNPKTNSLKSLTSTTSSTTTSVDLKQSQSYSNQLNALQNANASIRNALGDIGNRIGLANVQSFVASNVALKKETKVEIKEETKTVTKQTIANEVQIQETKQEEKMAEEVAVTNSNNSCVMEEIDNDDEEEDEYEDIEEDEEEEILDIDIVDAGNPQLASDYVKDVYVYLNKLETEFRIQQNFLENKIVTPKMRSVLIDWLIQVHLKFQLLQETLYLCVWIIDAYLMVIFEIYFS
jgi:hypothetical protein